MDDLGRIRSQWEANGSPACDHRNRDRIYYLGTQDIDRGCLDCGEQITPSEDKALRERGL